MEDGSWYLRILWRLPQLPKKKIQLFIRLGDYFYEKSQPKKSRFCYYKAKELADNIGAVYYRKKTVGKLNKIGF